MTPVLDPRSVYFQYKRTVYNLPESENGKKSEVLEVEHFGIWID
jgi:hypothetical protein